MKTETLANQSALVTGATSGLGAAMATALESAGARVLRHGLGSGGDFCHDLGEDDAPERLIDEAFALDPSLQILVCNVGGFFDSPFLQMDRARFDKTLGLNVRHAYFLIQRFSLKLVAAGRPGAVVIVSSTNGFHPEENSTAYDLSKGALVMMTRTLALSLAPAGIRVNGIAPGLIRTGLTAGWMDAKPDVVEHYKRKIVLGRIGVPEDCAEVCVFLCSEAARYIVGQTLVVDGGLTLGQIGSMPA
jgi:NAD(P)-dependent dehydrogenase (short-subunit alcohol dehydrogenase family)